MRHVLSALVAAVVSFAHAAGVPNSTYSGDTLELRTWLVLKPIKARDIRDDRTVPRIHNHPGNLRHLGYMPLGTAEEEAAILSSDLAAGDSSLIDGTSWSVWDTLSAVEHNRVELNRRYGDKLVKVVSYGLVDITVAAPCTAVVEFSHDEGGLVWINRTFVHSGLKYGGLFRDPYEFSAVTPLHAGRNRVAVKIDNFGGGMGVRFRLRQAAGAFDAKASDSARTELTRRLSVLQSLRDSARAAVKAISPNAPGRARVLAEAVEERLGYLHDDWTYTGSWDGYGGVAETFYHQFLKACATAARGENPLASTRGPLLWAYWSDLTASAVPFCVYVPPAYASSRSWPMAVVLHGRGGTCLDYLRITVLDTDPPDSTIVLSPSGRGSTGYRGAGERDVWDLVTLMRATCNVDSLRISVAGGSMGAFGSYYLLPRSRGLFAAAAPSCGCADLSRYHQLRNRPIWALHGVNDEMVNYPCSPILMDLLMRHGAPFQLTADGARGHDLSGRAFEDGDVVEWMSHQARSPAPPSVHLSGVATGAEGVDWLEYRDSPEYLWPYRLDAHRDSTGAIRMTTHNVNEFALRPPVQWKVGRSVLVDGSVVAVRRQLRKGPVLFARNEAGAWVARGQSAPMVAPRWSPAIDMLRQPTLFVYATADPARAPKLRALCESLAYVKHGNFPVYADTALPAELLRTRHLWYATAQPEADTLFGEGWVVRTAQSHAPAVWDHFEQSADSAGFMLHTLCPANAKREMLLLAFGHALVDSAADGSRLFEMPYWSDLSAAVLGKDGNVVYAAPLGPDWNALPPDKVIALRDTTRTHVADTLMAILSARCGADSALLLLPKDLTIQDCALTTHELASVGAYDYPCVVGMEGSRVKALLDTKNRWYEVFVRGVAADSLEPDREYRLATTTAISWAVKGDLAVQVIDTPFCEWLR